MSCAPTPGPLSPANKGDEEGESDRKEPCNVGEASKKGRGPGGGGGEPGGSPRPGRALHRPGAGSPQPALPRRQNPLASGPGTRWTPGNTVSSGETFSLPPASCSAAVFPRAPASRTALPRPPTATVPLLAPRALPREPGPGLPPTPGDGSPLAVRPVQAPLPAKAPWQRLQDGRRPPCSLLPAPPMARGEPRPLSCLPGGSTLAPPAGASKSGSIPAARLGPRSSPPTRKTASGPKNPAPHRASSFSRPTAGPRPRLLSTARPSRFHRRKPHNSRPGKGRGAMAALCLPACARPGQARPSQGRPGPRLRYAPQGGSCRSPGSGAAPAAGPGPPLLPLATGSSQPRAVASLCGSNNGAPNWAGRSAGKTRVDAAPLCSATAF